MNDKTSAAQAQSTGATPATAPSVSFGTVTLDHAGFRWLVRSDAAEAMFGPRAPDWSDLEREPQAFGVKAGFRRMTWRIAMTDRAVYAKVFSGCGLWDRAKSILGLTSVQREWRRARKAESLAIPVARPLAVGASRGGPTLAVYICEAFENAQTLPQTWARVTTGPTTEHDRRALIAAVASLYAVGHHHGMYQTDGHPNNILVRRGSGTGFDAVFIDLPWVRIRRRPLGTSVTASSLAQLDHYFHRQATKADRVRFVHAYYVARHAFEDDRVLTDRIRVLLTAIAEARGRHKIRLAKRRDRRLRGKSAYFRRIRLGQGWRGLFAMRLRRRHVVDVAVEPDRTEADWRRIMRTISASPTPTQANGCTTVNADGLHITTAKPSGFYERIRWTMGGSPVLRAFLDAHRRRHRDEPAPLFLGYAEHRRRGLVDLAVTFHPAVDTSNSPPSEHRATEGPHGSD